MWHFVVFWPANVRRDLGEDKFTKETLELVRILGFTELHSFNTTAPPFCHTGESNKIGTLVLTNLATQNPPTMYDMLG